MRIELTRSVWVAALLLTACGFVRAGQDAAGYTATVAPFDEAPKVDGQLDQGEWDRAIQTSGFQLPHQGGWLEHRKTHGYFGFTKDRAYIAIVSELPPDKELRASRKYRDSDVIYDGAIEVALDPNRTARESGQSDAPYYWMIGNSIGTILDQVFRPGDTPDKGWDGEWTFENALHKDEGVWVAELSIPWADLGVEGDVIGRTVGVLLARDYKRPWDQVAWFPHRGSFDGWKEYPRIRLTEDAPNVQVRSLGDQLEKSALDLQGRIVNPGPARKVEVMAHAESSDMPAVDSEQTIEVPAGGSKPFSFQIKPGRFHTDAEHTLDLTVRPADGGEPYLRWAIKRWRSPKGPVWKVQTGPQPERAVRLGYYPSFGKVRIKLDTTHLKKEAEKVQSGTLTITGADGKELIGEKLQWDGAGFRRVFDVGELEAGQYTATLTLDGYDRSFERTFKRKHFAFEGNQLGVPTKVLPPFEPVKVDGGTVSVVQRRYEKTGLGLWGSVKALGEQMLAGPVSLVANGADRITGDGKFTKKENLEAVYKGSAEHPAVNVETKTITEFDGCMRVEMTLKPGAKKEKLDSLTLDIPIQNSRAPLWHVTTTALRSNPAGATPGGKGYVWGSDEFPDGNWYGNFKPYIWLGGERRGLCWFADNDRNWVLDGNAKKGQFDPCLTLHRKDGVLTLRVHFVQKPTKITDSRKIVFGLMASPAKPMPDDWRKVLYNTNHEGYETFRWMGAQYWGSPTQMFSAYPVNGDFSIISKMQEYRLTGRAAGMEQWLDRWMERNFGGVEDLKQVSHKSRDRQRQLARISLRSASRSTDARSWSVYWEEFHHTRRVSHPEVGVFGNEWSGGFGMGGVHTLTDSYIDFACWYGAEFLRRGIGLYFDNTFPKRSGDPLLTNAYRLPNGDVQPTANMWAHREYLKRIWTLHRQLAPAETKPAMMLHMTNTHVVPYMVFNDYNLDLEWMYGAEPQQSKFSPDLLRAQSIGLQTGNIPTALSKVQDADSKQQLRKASRSRIGTLMVHEIKPQRGGKKKAGQMLYNKLLASGYGADDATIHNYWNDDDPAQPDDERIKTLLIERGGEGTVLLCTWNPEPANATIRFDTKALGFTPAEAVDVETGEKLSWKGNRLKLKLDGYATRLVRLK